jgi:hypothetical protein
MQKYLTEQLAEINENPELIKQKIGDAALTILFKHAFNPEFKFILPEGEPPFKKDPAPIGMTYGNLRQELRTFYVFCRVDLKAVKREGLFIQLLENVHPTEAALLIAIKDQELTKLYPNITHQMAFDNGFVQNAPTEKAPKKSTKKSTGVA